jgi:hypothetical protein
MRTGNLVHRFGAVGAVAAALASVLLAGQPATAKTGDGGPSVLAARSCRVIQWMCVTEPLWVPAGATVHIATTGVPWGAPWEPGEPEPVNSFVLIRYMDGPGDPEVRRDNKKRGVQHDWWISGLPAGNYRAELHCPYQCPNAVLYFAN